MTYEAILKTLPNPVELRRRAILFSKIEEYLGENRSTFIENFNGNDSDLYFWEDGTGNEAYIVFKADSKNDNTVLMFAYDHESPFNVYGEDKTKQLAFIDIPTILKPLLNEEKLKWAWDEDKDKIVYATSAAWKLSETEGWEASSTLTEALDYAEENGGFLYAFELFMRPLDEIRIIKEYEDLGYPEEALKEIRNIFQAYYIK